MKEVKPLNDKILIQLIPEEQETAGGLYIPDTAKNTQTKGIVKALGDGVEINDGTIRPIPLNIEDRILFLEGRGIEVKIDGDDADYKIISIKDVLATIKE